MDEADLAQRQDACLLGAAVERARGRAGRILERCMDCGEEIPEERRELLRASALPCERCVTCQRKAERGGRCPS